MLLAKDVEKEIMKEHVRKEPKKNLDTKLVFILEELPSETGVYYFHNENGDIIYVGKSRNIRKRVNQHFTNDNPKSREMQKKVASVSFELTGNELIALLKENQTRRYKQHAPWCLGRN